MSSTMKATMLVLVLVLSSTAVFAAPVAEDRPAAQPLSTVAAVKDMEDDTRVTLRGNVIEHIRSDHYMFRDATGDIQLELDEQQWGKMLTNPMSPVEVSGVVDKGILGVEVDVTEVREVPDSEAAAPVAHGATTVAAMKELDDETPVTLQGYLDFESRSGDDFQFRDDTGSITVHIAEEVWKGLVPHAGEKYEITGIVDEGILSTGLEVQQIRKIADAPK